MVQKYEQYTFVEVRAKILNFRGQNIEMVPKFTGIVEGTYSELYGGSDVKSYSVYKCEISKDRTVSVVNCISWYPEDYLKASSYQNKEKAKELVDKYKSKK